MEYRCTPTLLTLNLNTMKNTGQRYKLYFTTPSILFLINTYLTLYIQKKGCRRIILHPFLGFIISFCIKLSSTYSYSY